MYRQVSARFESEAAARAWVNDMRRAFIDPCVDEAVTAERHRCAAIANGIGNVARRNSAAGSAERLVANARAALAYEIESAILDGVDSTKGGAA
jgi:hypothetical protein